MAEQDYSDDMTHGGFGQEQEDSQGYDESQRNDEAMDDGTNGGSYQSFPQGQQNRPQGTGNSSANIPGKDEDRKLFVGALSWETTDKDLRDYFGKYGEIESVNVKTDSLTGRSRGFAFIVFKESEAIDKILAAGDHHINNKKVDPKKAKARHGKIFVGGLPPDATDDEIRDFFAKFGSIVEVEMPFDKMRGQRKGFCFITYDNDQVVQELLKTPKQTIKGKDVDVKKATPRTDAPMGMGGMPMGMRGRGGPMGMRGAPRGRGGPPTGGWGGPGGYPPAHGGYYGGYNQGYGGYGGGYDYYGNPGGYAGSYTGWYDGSNQPGYNSAGGYSGGKTRGGRGAPRHQPY